MWGHINSSHPTGFFFFESMVAIEDKRGMGTILACLPFFLSITPLKHTAVSAGLTMGTVCLLVGLCVPVPSSSSPVRVSVEECTSSL